MSTTVIQPLALELALPWQPVKEQEEQFKKWGIRILSVLLLLFIVVPWLPVFEIELKPREKELVKTKVILKKEQIELPKPKEVIVQEKPKVVPKPKEKPPKVEAKQEKAKPKLGNTKAEASDTKPVSTKASVAQKQGLSKVANELSSLRGSLNLAGMKKKKITSKKAGTVATVGHEMLGENRTDREATGISVNETLMKGEVTELTAHESTAVKGVISEGVSDGSAEYRSYQSGQRDMDSIRRTFEEKKGAIYALYNRALDEYPELNGKFVFSLVILPNGKITNLKLVNSELSLTSLEQDMLSRIAQIEFGEADVSSTEVEYKFVFIPS